MMATAVSNLEGSNQERGTFIDNTLSKLYYTLGNAESFSSARHLFDEAKKHISDITRREVDDWLSFQVAHTRHKKPRFTFPRRKVLILRVNSTWANDLIQIDSLSSYNSGKNYIMVNVDCFSRRIFTRALSTKSKSEIEAALRSIIAENGGISPYYLWTDEAKEYLALSEFYDEMEIVRYSTHSPLKSVFVERKNKDLENLLYKIMTSENTANWTHCLQEATQTLNNRPSSVLHGLTPMEAHKIENEEFLREKFLEDYKKHKARFQKQKSKFKLHDRVRILKKRQTFSRGYEPAFERDITRIKEILKTYPLTYKVEGKQRAFYASELVRAEPALTPESKKYFIERTRRINRKKHRSGISSGGETQYLLKSKNDSDLSSWINEYEYQKLKQDGYLQ